jgi:photosystem II stability/assembly factor-like uncharacterized protein
MRHLRLLHVSVLTALCWLHGASPVAAQSWVNVTGNLANMASECGNLQHLAAAPTSGRVVAGVALKGLWANTTGDTWSQLGTGGGSAVIVSRPTWFAFDPANPGTFWESGIYNNGGVYRTTDNGVTFQRLGSIGHNDYISVNFNDANRQLLLAGGHEQSRTVYRSIDGGQNWTNIGANLPADTKFSGIPIVVTPQIYVVNAAGWGGSTGGIYRTTDSGTTWQRVSTFEPGMPPLILSNGTIYWPVYNGLIKSTDGGVTWNQLGGGLLGVTPTELPDGRVATVAGNRLVVSSDGGTTWSAIGANLPYTPNGVSYSASRRAFFIFRWDCGAVVLPDAVMRLDYDVTPSIPAPPTNLRIVTP